MAVEYDGAGHGTGPIVEKIEDLMIRTLRWVTALGALTVGVAALSACGGGGSGGSDSSTSSAAGTPASNVTAAATQSSGSNGGSSDELKAVAKKFAASTFRATYKATGTGADTFSGGHLVLYKDGEKRLRFDATVNEDGQDMEIIFIATETVSAFCLKDAGEVGALVGVQPGQGVCLNSNPDDKNNPVGSLSSLFSDIENIDVTMLEKSSRNVAGKEAACYKKRDNRTDDVSTDCFTKDGVLMYSQTEGSSAFEMEATDVSGSVSGSDFDLPYEVRDLPAGLGG